MSMDVTLVDRVREEHKMSELVQAPEAQLVSFINFNRIHLGNAVGSEQIEQARVQMEFLKDHPPAPGCIRTLEYHLPTLKETLNALLKALRGIWSKVIEVNFDLEDVRYSLEVPKMYTEPGLYWRDLNPQLDLIGELSPEQVLISTPHRAAGLGGLFAVAAHPSWFESLCDKQSSCSQYSMRIWLCGVTAQPRKSPWSQATGEGMIAVQCPTHNGEVAIVADPPRVISNHIVPIYV